MWRRARKRGPCACHRAKYDRDAANSLFLPKEVCCFAPWRSIIKKSPVAEITSSAYPSHQSNRHHLKLWPISSRLRYILPIKRTPLYVGGNVFYSTLRYAGPARNGASAGFIAIIALINSSALVMTQPHLDSRRRLQSRHAVAI